MISVKTRNELQQRWPETEIEISILPEHKVLSVPAMLELPERISSTVMSGEAEELLRGAVVSNNGVWFYMPRLLVDTQEAVAKNVKYVLAGMEESRKVVRAKIRRDQLAFEIAVSDGRNSQLEYITLEAKKLRNLTLGLWGLDAQENKALALVYNRSYGHGRLSHANTISVNLTYGDGSSERHRVQVDADGKNVKDGCYEYTYREKLKV